LASEDSHRTRCKYVTCWALALAAMPAVTGGGAMTDIARGGHQAAARPRLDSKVSPIQGIIFVGLLAAGILFTTYSLYSDVSATGASTKTLLPFVLLGIALLVALGFEFVNGFHDTANAVATVIYTNSLPPHFAVVWSGCFNFLGVLLSTGAVA